jgi:hypothetical protein
MTSRVRSMAAICAMSSLGITPPVGLAGEFRMTSFVLFESRERSVSRSNEKPRLSITGTPTGVAPRKLMSDS